MPDDEILSPRALNRALLQRQGLLARTGGGAGAVIAMVERLVGLQAQVPSNPYVALWSRLEGFRPEELSELVERGAAVRAQVMRGTIHLVSARDCLAMRPLTQPVLTRAFRTNFTKRMGGADLDEVVAAGAELLAAGPRTRTELAATLAPRWPAAEPDALAQAVTFHCPVVQIPPRGLWRQSGQPTWAPAEAWLGAPLDEEAAIEDLLLRYLAAFGPATVSDMRTWCNLTGLRDVVERLRPRLRTFRDHEERELLDVLDGPLPDPDVPAPPRFLPEFDNLLLSHADRARVLHAHGPGLPFPRGTWIGTLLVDGFYRANWKIAEEKDAATLTIDRFTARPDDPAGTAEDIAAEAARLLAFVAPDAADHRVRLASAR